MEIEKADISAVWLDITNAHGAVPCQLIFFAFRHYGLHPDIITLLEAYYNGLWSRYLSTNSPSSWHHYSRGTFKSFTIFILFLSALNVAIEFILADANSLQCFKTLLVKAFMDDLFLEAKNVDELQILVVYWNGQGCL